MRGLLTAPESGCSEKATEREFFFIEFMVGERTNLVDKFYWCIDPSTYLLVISTTTTAHMPILGCTVSKLWLQRVDFFERFEIMAICTDKNTFLMAILIKLT